MGTEPRRNELTLAECIDMYRGIHQRFQKIEGRPWGAEGAVIELSKQVGELSKLVMSSENYYFSDRYDSNSELIGDELADIFAAIIRLSDHYEIDLEKAFVEARKNEARSLDEMGV